MTELAEKTPAEVPSDADDDALELDEPRESLWRRTPWDVRAFVGMLALALVAYAWLGTRSNLPHLFPDEFLYGGLAKSVANGDGLTYRDAPQGVLSILYVLSIVPAWLVAAGESAYTVAKLLNTLYAVLVAVPVWLLVRRLSDDRRIALAAAGLTLIGSWMLLSNEVLTENVAYPLAVGALAATVIALREPGSRSWLVALGLMGAAALARTHVAAFAAVLVLAPLVDVLRQPRSERSARARAHRSWLSASAGLVVLAVIVVFGTDFDALGRYGGSLGSLDTDAGDTAKWAAYHGLAVVIAVGVLPVVATLALAARARNWRDDDIGPLLVVIACSVVVVCGVAGWFISGPIERVIERYAMYVAPLLIVAFVLAPRRVDLRTTLAMAVAVAAALLAIPTAREILEAPALFSARQLAADVGGVFGERPGVGVALFGLIVGVGGGLLLAAPAPRPKPKKQRSKRQQAVPPDTREEMYVLWTRYGPVAAMALVGLVLLVQTAWSADKRIDDLHQQGAGLPDDLEWVKHAAKGRPVALLTVEPQTTQIDFVTELMNSNVNSAYALEGSQTVPLGKTCGLTIAENGTLTAKPGCPPPPPDLVVEDAVSRLHLQAENARRATVYAGTYLSTAAKRPRLLSMISPPCSNRTGTCTGYIGMRLWLPEKALVLLTFNGSAKDEAIAVPGDRTYKIPGRALSRLRLEVPAGHQELKLPVSWQGLAGPELQTVVIENADGSETTLY